MAWDASRPVPWRRLAREWLIYVGIMAALFLLLFQNGNPVGILAGLLVSGPLYLLIGYVMAKFGYQRKTWGEMRSESRRPSSDDRSPDGPSGPRPKPAPTSRTGGGTGRPGGPRKKRR